MLASAFLLLLNGAFLSLRLGAGSGSFPRPLPAKEERRCVERWMQGDLEARNTLIEHNLRLVAHIIKKYYTSESEQDDLISIGTVGLIKGVSTYRPDKGVRLATYASRCIENEVLMHFRGSRKSAGDLSLSDSIENTAMFQYMNAHCQEFGFILRFPDGMEPITGVMYEPFHFRYVGVEAAKYITENHICFETFVSLYRDIGTAENPQES